MLTVEMVCRRGQDADGLEQRRCMSCCSPGACSLVLWMYSGLAGNSTFEALGARPVDVREEEGTSEWVMTRQRGHHLRPRGGEQRQRKDL
jgi:hypothetical protein